MRYALPNPFLEPFVAASRDFGSGASSPRRILERCLERIDAHEEAIKAWVVLDVQAARRAADEAGTRWKDNRPLSAIDGMPFGIKDMIETGDMPTQMGSPLFDGHRPRFDSAGAYALRTAGAVILGKTVTTEFASTFPGVTRNPWDNARTPGGSSSGSAASVASGMLSGALGTQVVGSTIRPAGYCGCVGFKPSFGALNRGGSLDYLSQSCLGVLAASLEDAWGIAIEIARRVGGDPGQLPLSGPLRLPLPRRPKTLLLLETPGWEQVTEETRKQLQVRLGQLEAAGIRIITRREDAAAEALEQRLADALRITRQINAWEWLWPLGAFAAHDHRGLSQASIDRLAEARGMEAEEYRGLLQEREEVRSAHAGLAARIDAMITLSAPGPAPLGLRSTGNAVFAVPASILGAPAISLPLLAPEGLPLGLQLVGFRQGDADLFGIAAEVNRICME